METKVSDTVSVIKKKAGFIWQIIQTIIIAVVIGLASWMFYTIDDLQEKVASIDTVNKENMAQWKSLVDLSERVKDNEVKVEVNQRIFQMLLDQNRIKIKLQEDSVEELQETKGDMPTQERVRAFREEKMREFSDQRQTKK
jgi:hypothetical protein